MACDHAPHTNMHTNMHTNSCPQGGQRKVRPGVDGTEKVIEARSGVFTPFSMPPFAGTVEMLGALASFSILLAETTKPRSPASTTKRDVTACRLHLCGRFCITAAVALLPPGF